jgi:hypothetical protein
MDVQEAYNRLIYATDVAARRALGNGLGRDEVAQELEALADAIRDPGSVAEDMSPIGPDDKDPDPDVVLNR